MAVHFAKTPPRPRGDVDLCIVGNLTIDVIFRGITQMPEWGQEVICDNRTEAVAGQAGGMAFACAKLGVRTEVVAEVGEDAAGERIRRELGAAVGVEAVTTVPGGTTPTTVALVRPDGERAFLSDLGHLRPIDTGSMVQRWPRQFASSVVALVGTFNLPDLDLRSAAELLGQLRRAGALTVFDPGWDPGDWARDTVEGIRAILAETDLFLPNLDEARALTGQLDVGRVLGALSDVCPGIVVMKGGETGSYLAVDGQVVVVESLPTKADNAVGAGDVYDAGVIAGFLRGDDVLSSMSLGAAAASFYVARRTDRFPTYEESAELAESVTTSTI
ncbi:MAG: PfkB family carbohydrate kinase [Acidimicrobiales bacterium]|jgi:sugar/nucleoside kinase (ribokinase family)